jgi:hypothetical protein
MEKSLKHIAITLLFLFFYGLSGAQPVKIWVSPDGSDQNAGTKEAPCQSLMMAQRKARELRRLNAPSIQEGIEIVLTDGNYQLNEPLIFRPEDSGTPESPTTIMASDGAHPILSGGIPIKNWKKAKDKIPGLPEKASGNVWMADIPTVGGNRLAFRQMWINQVKSVRASTLNDGKLDRILSADKENECLWIPIPGFSQENTNQLELVIHQWWAIANLRVKNIETVGNKAKVTFYQPESRIEFEHPWPAPFIDEKKELNGNSAFYFANSIALLNSPGEWYEDINAGKVYYWPRKGEDMQKAEVIVPCLETLLSIEGSVDSPVSNIIFKGLQFEHTTWLRPSLAGHVPLQAGMYIYDAYKLLQPGTPDKASLENQAWTGRQPAGFTARNASHIEIQNCEFRHMAATGIDFISGTNHNLVQGCIISDIGGTGIQLGYFGGRNFEAHLPYNPIDQREVCQYETLSNNLITDVTNEDWGCVGISVGFAHDINIEHNEVSHLNYSGICVGWGWTKTITCMKNNRVYANYIHHFAKNMYDVGGVYTLSAQPNTEISKNRIEHLEKAPYAHIPEHYQYIYYDEGSSYIRAVDNWTEKEKFFSNSPGPGNEWVNNGPQVDDKIKSDAGLTNNYKYLRKEYDRPVFPY